MSRDPAMVREHPLPNCYAPELLMVVRGEGVWLEDRAGKRYLDFAGGIAVNALGYGREDLADIARKQMLKLTHISNLFITEPAYELARKMLTTTRELCGREFQAVQFLSSGSEANETALKYARLHSLRKKGAGAHKLLSFSGAFHGRTMGSLSVTPNPKYQDPFGPLVPGVHTIGYNDVDALERTLDASFAGVIVEVVQGEGGLATMTREFAAALNRRCRAAQAILIADEVQTGLGRTGDFYASLGVGLEPDLITLAKPLAGGLPLSAVLIPPEINGLIHVGEHGTTFGGGPVTTAVAGRVWEELTRPEFIAGVRQTAAFLEGRLEELAREFPQLCGGLRGKGLLRGVEILLEDLTPLVDALREEGLLVLRSGLNVLRLAPPLVISRDELDAGIGILRRVFAAHLAAGSG